jgi:hypothetical protein
VTTTLLTFLKRTVIALTLVALVPGCAWSVGGSKNTSSTNQPIHPPTQGQELMDLKKAHDEGAVSDEEYQELRQRVLDR